MSKNIPMKLLNIALLLAALLAGAAPAWAQRLALRVLETSDVHMHLTGYDYYQDRPGDEYGLDRTATLIAAARAEVRNTLLFDNGDLLQGNPLGDYVARVRPPAAGEVHPAIRALNALGYDAANVGNHEFNYGLPFLQQALRGAAFPVLNANLVVDDGRGRPDRAEPLFTPWVILDRRFADETGTVHAIKIGVVGFAPPQVLQWDRQHLLGRVAALDIVETARDVVPRIRAAGADVVVVIAHSGFERTPGGPMAENTVARLAQIPGVSAILFGHSHGEFPGAFFSSYSRVDLSAGTINGVPATMPGFWGSHLGVIDLTLEKHGSGWKTVAGRAELRPVHDRAARRVLVAADARIAALVRPEHDGTLAYMRETVATASAPIQSYFAQVADSPSVQVVADAQRAHARRALAGTPHAALPLLSAAAPFKSGGRGGANYYTDIAAGPLMRRHVADLYVYPNTIKIVRATGVQLREWIEFAAGAFNRIDPAGPPAQDLLNPGFPSYNFDTIDGVTYRIDVTQPARYDRSGALVAPQSRRVVDLRHEGRPVGDADVFAVVTNNYRAAGGGNFPGLDGSTIVFDSPDENRQAVLEHLQAAGRFDPSADGNWRVAPVPGIALRFTAGAGGIPHLKATPQVVLVRELGDGTALYELRP